MPISDAWGPLTRSPINAWDREYKKPVRVSRAFLAENGCQQVTINSRSAFFGDRRYADETNFTGFIATVITAKEDASGRIAFPNRTWNGIIGDFRIDGTLYPVDNQHRDIAVSLKAGKNLFLLQVSESSMTSMPTWNSFSPSNWVSRITAGGWTNRFS